MTDTGTLVSLQGRCIQCADTVCTLHTVNSCLAGSAGAVCEAGSFMSFNALNFMCALDLWISHSI